VLSYQGQGAGKLVLWYMKIRKIKILLFLGLFVLLLAVASFTFVYFQVSRETSERIQKGAINRIIFSESPVYYDDGKSILGVFFERTHRKYIQYKDIPPVFIKALVATEDKNFFKHHGFDLRAIARALVANIRARKVIQGGSTITQQTAKNIFKRQRRSLKAKIKELVQAMLLERKYTKQEILEMYVNQFFVTGFGRGLRIAAQYYFDKKAKDLDLVEAAFIAGSVKSPNRYNPFTKKTEAEKKKAMRLAKMRKDYVLSNMLKMKFINREQYLTARQREVPFKQGRVSYRLNVMLDYIREQLESEYFKKILEEQGIENIATSGIKIYTSINKEIQEGALRSIRSHLPLLDVQLSGYDEALLQKRYRDLANERLIKQEAGLPFLCQVTHVERSIRNPYIMVAWDNGGGIIDYKGLLPLADAWIKGRVGKWAKFERRNVLEFLKHFHTGDLVAVQFVGDGKENGKTHLLLTEIPTLEGGIVVMQAGMIKAMVGGFFDRFFNRAVDAKRQLGSIFKPIVFTAALQLKWNNLDPLVNKPDLFKFEKTFYVPKPDHKPKSEKVSLAWAGAKSENLATVWLLYHLTDRLNMSEFRKVVELLGVAQKKGESYFDYSERIRDKYGVVVDNQALMEAAFEEAKKEVASDIIFGGYEEALPTLGRLHYRIDKQMFSPDRPEEYEIRRLSFTELNSENFEMKERLKRIKELLYSYTQQEDPRLEEIISKELAHFYVKQDTSLVERIVYKQNFPSSGDSRLVPIAIAGRISTLEKLAAQKIWIDGVLPSGALDMLDAQVKEVYERLIHYRRYDPEVLYKISDFRRLVNLLYVVRLSEELGVSTHLDPVLSFPLGANSISILEAGRTYQSIVSGKVYRLDNNTSSSMVPIITKIEDREGKTVWEYTPSPQKILSTRISGQISDILRLVMEQGTGRKARNSVRLSTEIQKEKVGITIPTIGKTGTANRFTNSSFVGVIPAPSGEPIPLDFRKGYVVAAYVGYDDNRPMRGKKIAIYGASGALPLWIDTANAIVNSKTYRDHLEMADLVFSSPSNLTLTDRELLPVPVSSISGLPLGQAREEVTDHFPKVLSYAEISGVSLFLRRTFEPLGGVHNEEEN